MTSGVQAVRLAEPQWERFDSKTWIRPMMGGWIVAVKSPIALVDQMGFVWIPASAASANHPVDKAAAEA